MYLARTPQIVRALLPGFVWRMPGTEKVLYLTFDDGPIPEVTPWVLDTLAFHDARATFFCIGRNVEANGPIVERIINEGHTLGNHTWDHERGRATSTFSYLKSTLRCQALFTSSLFRPPYGSVTVAQYRALRKRYRIVLWDVLSGDFDTTLDGVACAQNVIQGARPGSIVVFHDSLKAEGRLRYALPRTLEHFGRLGYRFKALPNKP